MNTSSMDDEVAFVFVIKLAIAAAPNCGAVQWRRAPSKLPNGVRLKKKIFIKDVHSGFVFL